MAHNVVVDSACQSVSVLIQFSPVCRCVSECTVVITGDKLTHSAGIDVYRSVMLSDGRVSRSTSFSVYCMRDTLGTVAVIYLKQCFLTFRLPAGPPSS